MGWCKRRKVEFRALGVSKAPQKNAIHPSLGREADANSDKTQKLPLGWMHAAHTRREMLLSQYQSVFLTWTFNVLRLPFIRHNASRASNRLLAWLHAGIATRLEVFAFTQSKNNLSHISSLRRIAPLTMVIIFTAVLVVILHLVR